MKNHTPPSSSLNLGILCALTAALLNSMTGIFSKVLLKAYAPNDISYTKCLVAFVLTGIWILFTGAWKKSAISWNFFWIGKVALCALFGVSAMYLFETIAYEHVIAPVVVLCLMGASTIITLILGHYCLKERLTWFCTFCLGLILIGLFLMVPDHAEFRHFMGIFLGVLAGICYGIFLLLTKYFKLASNSVFMWFLVGFGALFLAPFSSNSMVLLKTPHAYVSLIPLAIFPTVLGFFFTAKALSYTTASTVQFFEITEPLFSAIFAYIALEESMTGKNYIGASFIIVSLVLYHRYKKRHGDRHLDIINADKPIP